MNNAQAIMFTSAGRRVSLIQAFRAALGSLGLDWSIVTADSRADAPAHAVGDTFELVPPVRDPSYADTLLDLCQQHGVRLLVPLIDPELPILSRERDAFAAIGTTLLLSSSETTEIAGDKRRTDAFFRANGIPTPRMLDPAEVLSAESWSWPVLLKPADGSGSADVTKARSRRELQFFLQYVPNAIVQEYVDGQEFTLDILVDFTGKVRCVVPRLRIETRAGEVSKAMTVRDPQLIAAGQCVARALPGALGCITVQCFRTQNGDLRFIEVNPRFGGGFPLSAAAGADFPRWIIEWVLGRDPEIAMDEWRDGLVMLRYDEGIFVDKAAIS